MKQMNKQTNYSKCISMCMTARGRTHLLLKDSEDDFDFWKPPTYPSDEDD